jgi:hypothetical protein
MRKITIAGPNDSAVRAHGGKLAFSESYASISAINTQIHKDEGLANPYTTFCSHYIVEVQCQWRVSGFKRYLMGIIRIHGQTVKVKSLREYNIFLQ